MTLTDTTPEARAAQLKVHQAMSGEQRLLLAFEMSVFAREVAAAHLREQHPGWSEAEVSRELIRIAFLPDLPPPPFR